MENRVKVEYTQLVKQMIQMFPVCSTGHVRHQKGASFILRAVANPIEGNALTRKVSKE